MSFSLNKHTYQILSSYCYQQNIFTLKAMFKNPRLHRPERRTAHLHSEVLVGSEILLLQCDHRLFRAHAAQVSLTK